MGSIFRQVRVVPAVEKKFIISFTGINHTFIDSSDLLRNVDKSNYEDRARYVLFS